VFCGQLGEVIFAGLAVDVVVAGHYGDAGTREFEESREFFEEESRCFEFRPKTPFCEVSRDNQCIGTKPLFFLQTTQIILEAREERIVRILHTYGVPPGKAVILSELKVGQMKDGHAFAWFNLLPGLLRSYWRHG
jgi:hypothetical protein